jgi:hypothetical protein
MTYRKEWAHMVFFTHARALRTLNNELGTDGKKKKRKE